MTRRSIEKVTDILARYLDPAGRAVLPCLDKQSQIEAPDHAQPSLSLKKGRAATITRDDKHHATSRRFVALAVKSDRVIAITCCAAAPEGS